MRETTDGDFLYRMLFEMLAPLISLLVRFPSIILSDDGRKPWRETALWLTITRMFFHSISWDNEFKSDFSSLLIDHCLY